MPSSNCGGTKSPVCRPIPAIPGYSLDSFPAGQWVQVVDWSGFTVQTLVHRVLVTPADAVVKWRRRANLLAVTEGTFQGEIDFNVKPTDLKLTIDLWIDEPAAEVTVEFVGAVGWTSPSP